MLGKKEGKSAIKVKSAPHKQFVAETGVLTLYLLEIFEKEFPTYNRGFIGAVEDDL